MTPARPLPSNSCHGATHVSTFTGYEYESPLYKLVGYTLYMPWWSYHPLWCPCFGFGPKDDYSWRYAMRLNLWALPLAHFNIECSVTYVHAPWWNFNGTPAMRYSHVSRIFKCYRYIITSTRIAYTYCRGHMDLTLARIIVCRLTLFLSALIFDMWALPLTRELDDTPLVMCNLTSYLCLFEWCGVRFDLWLGLLAYFAFGYMTQD